VFILQDSGSGWVKKSGSGSGDLYPQHCCNTVLFFLLTLITLIHVDPNLLPGLLLPPHHIQVHALLLLLVALAHVHIALLVPLIVWIPDVIVIIVIIVIIIL
jgi:hypothetical protein